MSSNNQELSVFQNVLGHDFYKMPAVFRHMHGPSFPVFASGNIEVEYGRSILAKIASFFMPIPATGTHPMELKISSVPKGEFWERKFPDNRMTSTQYERKGIMFEKYGLSHFAFKLNLSDSTLIFNCQGQYLGFIPLPGFLSVKPYAVAVAVDDNSWELEISIHFWGALLAKYSGVLHVNA